MKTITLITALQRLAQCLLVGSLLAITGTTQAMERVTYYHNDALGSPVAATDATGTLLWREEYTPYGERLKKEASSKDTLWYTGKQEEATFGINYFGARWYDPQIGRFMGVDPVGFDPDNIHSFSKYAYGNNNPYKYLDPDGNSPLDIGFFIADSIKLGIAINSGNPTAIQSAAADLAGSALGLISPVPGTGQFIKGARTGSKLTKGGTVTVRHYTSTEGRSAISKAGSLREGTYVTKPGEIPGRAGHKQIENMLEIGPGKGTNYIDVEVPTSRLSIPSNGATTSGHKWQRQLTEKTHIDSTSWRRPPGRPVGE